MTRSILLYVVVLLSASAAVAAAVWLYPSPGESPSAEARTAPRPPPTVPILPKPRPRPESPPTLPAGFDIRFVDVTAKAGIQFKHFDGRTEMEYIMDQTGSGLAWIDYDQDGLLDLFVVQGYAVVAPFPEPAPTSKMFRNLGDGRFRDVTAEVGLGHVGFGQGAAVGDIDNDGYPDLFLTCYGKQNVLYHNVPDGKGGRRFADVTAKAGIAEHPDWKIRPNYSTSAAFLDLDNDGRLDLFVCSYVKIDLDNYPVCKNSKGRIGPCPPRRFEGTRCLLFRNNGDGTFRDVSREAGIDNPGGKALGVVALDLDDDGWTDIFVANDTEPNFLFRNLGNGRFESLGPVSGAAVNLAGTPQAYMGVDADDLNGNGRPDLFVTAFARETNTFFRNEGKFQFLDVTHSTGLGPPSWMFLGFGTCFLDVDRDGSLDIVVANGHVSRNIDEENEPGNTFRQNAQLFLNDGRGRFRELTSRAGAYFAEKHVGRGVAVGDYDNDGRVDLAFSNSGEETVLLHNESTTPYHWIRISLQGTKSNRDAVGARVTVHIGDRKIVRHRKGGGSYLSASDPRLLVGLGAASRVDQVEIRWPSGLQQRFGPLDVDRGYVFVEGEDKVRESK